MSRSTLRPTAEDSAFMWKKRTASDSAFSMSSRCAYRVISCLSQRLVLAVLRRLRLQNEPPACG